LELGGGAALIAGLATRLIGLLLAGEMAVAIWKGEHFFAHPLAVDQYGLALALGVGAFALATFGGGIISLDTLFGNGRSARVAKSRPERAPQSGSRRSHKSSFCAVSV